MEPYVSSYIMFLETTKQSWDVVKNAYSQEKNILRIYQSYEDIFGVQ